MELDERPDGIIGRFIYNSDVFGRHTIQEMRQAWRTIVRQATTGPIRRISELVPAFDQLRKALAY